MYVSWFLVLFHLFGDVFNMIVVLKIVIFFFLVSSEGKNIPGAFKCLLIAAMTESEYPADITH
jgi:hypothetical protein